MIQMERLAAIALLLGGCAGGVQNVEDNPLFAAAWTGPPPHVGVQVTGPGASADKQQRCAATVQKAGGVVDAAAPMQVLLTLDDKGNRLQVLSQRRGLVRDEARPAWTLDRLCKEALEEAAVALQAERPGGWSATTSTAPTLSPGPTSLPPHGPNDNPTGPAPLPAQSGGSAGPIQ